MDPVELILLTIFGFGSWVILMFAFVIYPIRRYLITGKVWSRAPSRLSYIVLEGKKAKWHIFFRSLVMMGLLDFIVSMLLFNRFAWEGTLLIFVSALLAYFITAGEKRVPLKYIFWLRKITQNFQSKIVNRKS
jgi:hypothetical protein